MKKSRLTVSNVVKASCRATIGAMRQHLLCVLAVLALACGGGGSSSSGSTSPPPPPPPPPSPNISLTLVARSLDPNYDAGQLYAYIGDAALTRANMPGNLNENAPAVRYTPGLSTNTATIQVPRGKTVTIFAVEFNTNGWRSERPPTPILTRPPREFVEFISWSGNPAQPEPGVAVFQATSDATITANFDRVESLSYRRQGCSEHKFEITGPGLLTFGRTVPDNAPDLSSTNGFSTPTFLRPESDFTLFWAKQGSTITLRAWPRREDRAAGISGFMNWGGSAAQCGTSFNCQVPIPSRANTPGPMVLVSGYAITNGITEGCNCSKLPGSPPCTQLP